MTIPDLATVPIPAAPSKPHERGAASVGSQRDRRFTDTFFDSYNAYARRIHYQITAGGAFKLQMSDSATRDTRCRIAFWNDGPSYTAEVTIEADTLGELQVKINGEYNRYTTAPQDLTWLFRPGPNEVQITIAEGASRLELLGLLYDGRVSRWTPKNWQSGWQR